MVFSLPSVSRPCDTLSFHIVLWLLEDPHLLYPIVLSYPILDMTFFNSGIVSFIQNIMYRRALQCIFLFLLCFRVHCAKGKQR